MHISNQEILYCETYRDRAGCSLCNPCQISVSDLGVYQCTGCLAVFGQADLKLVQAFLLKRFGLEDGKNEYSKLKQTKSLVCRKLWSQLRLSIYDFIEENGGFKTRRYFFELK